MDISFIWAAIIAVGVFMYVVLDGFDLGIGILFPFFPEHHDRDVMMNTVAPVWDGNETWLVLGGAGLFAAFPLAYASILSALYLPLIMMLICLIFRGVAFELRAKSRRTRALWDLAFMLGSAGATFCQGVALGGYISGIKVGPTGFVGGALDWFTPFSLFCGLGLLAAYSVLGAGWLIAKTEGELQRRMYRLMWPLTVGMLAAIAIVSLWTPLGDAAIAHRWFSMPTLLYLIPVPVLTLLCAAGVRYGVRKRFDRMPFIMALALVALCYVGFICSLWPNIIPPSVSIWDASSPHSSQMFSLVGVAIVLPIILIYTTMGYWIFRGKVRHDDPGYH
ncbi:cytochrome d ubiquinol oxidase subunit II [Robbsia sp. Bb-Pol-6]|uniref:Cytochrome d ubiquinol oxidase subunit II n=1 Tax=Robbsia betulipollinis TaxID=2981849 RepID=A0ABT3ZHF1_9BURK|nr:cytochrome d ubiquinol oxidase subunit II [Robbsia betulipollinis]MCY0385948.1 cytochrome d ubiquinol oxidase subunit II [Robbsia betulipollinis]